MGEKPGGGGGKTPVFPFPHFFFFFRGVFFGLGLGGGLEIGQKDFFTFFPIFWGIFFWAKNPYLKGLLPNTKKTKLSKGNWEKKGQKNFQKIKKINLFPQKNPPKNFYCEKTFLYGNRSGGCIFSKKKPFN